MQPHSKSIHLVIVDRFVPDLRRKTISVSGILPARAIKAWLVAHRVFSALDRSGSKAAAELRGWGSDRCSLVSGHQAGIVDHSTAGFEPMGAKSFDIGYPPVPCLWSGGPLIT
jgi:hypothetical protein